MIFSLPTHYRVRNTAQFDYVFKKRKRLYSGSLLTYYRSNQQDHPRIGVVISKRNLRFAVDRNRIRRVLKELFRLKQHELPSWDVVIVAQKGIGHLKNEELWQCGNNLINQLVNLSQKG